MQAKRILIIKPSALGDVATTLPLLCDLRAAMPDARIDWLIHPANAAVIEGHDALHEAIAFDRKKLSAWWFRPSAFGRLWALGRRLRKARYDIVIDAQGLFRSAFLTRLTGAKIRIGFDNAREGARFAYTHKIRLPDDGKKMIAVDRMRALGAAAGTRLDTPAQFRMPVQAEAKRDAEGILEGKPAPIVLIPGARWNTKRWPIDRYAEIALQLVREGHFVILLGSPDEKSLCDTLESTINNQQSKIETPTILNLAGQTTIPTMIALLARARLLIANDSGPLHIAAALGTPVIALYGPTSPGHVGPYAQLQNVLRHDVPCHPCRRRECDHHSCMQGLAVELVWERTARTLTPVKPATSPD